MAKRMLLLLNGYSGRIAASAIMPEKNAIAIYGSIYCPITAQFGLWDQ